MSEKHAENSEKKIIYIDQDLEEIVPRFLANMQKNVQIITTAAENGDFQIIRRLGHSMKGSGGGYGFHQISVIGMRIEEMALAKDGEAIMDLVKQLSDYLKSIYVIYK